MLGIYKKFIIILFLILPIATEAHVQHYANLNRIEFDIFRNDKHIGKHIFSFKRSNDELSVESEINFKIKKLGVVLYNIMLRARNILKRIS